LNAAKAFVQVREVITNNKALAKRVDEIVGNYNKKFAVVFDAISRLRTPPAKLVERKMVGYRRRVEE